MNNFLKLVYIFCFFAYFVPRFPKKNTIFAARINFCADVNTVFTLKKGGKAYD